MRFRSLLRPRRGLAWHCSTARIGPLPHLDQEIIQHHHHHHHHHHQHQNNKPIKSTFNVLALQYRQDRPTSPLRPRDHSTPSPSPSTPNSTNLSRLYSTRWHCSTARIGPLPTKRSVTSAPSFTLTRSWPFLVWCKNCFPSHHQLALFFVWCGLYNRA